MYPGLLMTLLVYARDVPLFSFHPEAVQLDLNVDIKAFAIQPNGTQTPLFKLNAVSTLLSELSVYCIYKNICTVSTVMSVLLF